MDDEDDYNYNDFPGLTEAGEAYELVEEFFKGDIAKTVLWFNEPNPLLGNIKPIDTIGLGRGAKLLKFIKNLLEENKRD